MSTVLIVDDSVMERELAGKMLQRLSGVSVAFAGDGMEAVAAIAASPPDLVVTDLQMPRMGGLELVTALRQSHPAIPVVLVTGFGSESIASDALHAGAASYVPKRNLARDLAPTVARTLELLHAPSVDAGARAFLVDTRHRFVLENDPAQLPPFIASLAAEARSRGVCTESESMMLSLALNEALSNALEHGNLEVDSVLREDGMDRYTAEIERRRHISPYDERRIHVDVCLTDEDATYVIRDGGAGFDHADLPDPTDPANLLKASGRGLLLMQTFMDDVQLNERGNEITLVKRRT